MSGFNSAAHIDDDIRPTSIAVPISHGNDSDNMPNLDCGSETEDNPDLDQHMAHFLRDASHRRYRQKRAEAKTVKH